MEFKYKAITNSGEVVEGVFVADSKHQVIEMLKSNNSFPVAIDEKKKVGTKEIHFKKGVSAKDLSFFCRQLHAMLRAGSTITKCLDIMKRQISNRILRDSVDTLYEDVQKGKMMSISMKQFPKVFPEMMIYMIESGEISGTLDMILLRLAVYFEKEAKLKNKIRSAMVYPIILSIVSVLVVIFMVTFIMPTFVTMFERSNVDLPGITKAMLNFSEFSRSNGLLIAVMVIITALLLIQYIASDNGRRNLDKLKLKLPVISGLNKKNIDCKICKESGDDVIQWGTIVDSP